MPPPPSRGSMDAVWGVQGSLDLRLGLEIMQLKLQQSPSCGAKPKPNENPRPRLPPCKILISHLLILQLSESQ